MTLNFGYLSLKLKDEEWLQLSGLALIHNKRKRYSSCVAVCKQIIHCIIIIYYSCVATRRRIIHG